jgi:hypothetical protein
MVVVVIFGAPAVELLLLIQLERATSEIVTSATVANARKRFITPPENSATSATERGSSK